MRNIPILIPEEAEQQRYRQYLDLVAAQRDRATKQLVEIGTLFSSLQHRAFSGQL
jgi:hypothetical protein